MAAASAGMTSINVARSDGARTVSAADARSCVNVLAGIAGSPGAIGDTGLSRGTADVIANEQQLLQQINHVGLVQGGQNVCPDLLPERGEMQERRVPLFGQVEPIGAPV